MSLLSLKARRFLLWVQVTLVLSVIPSVCLGGQFDLRPSVSFRQDYNSNLFFQPTDEEGDWVSRLSAGLEGRHETERFVTRLEGRLGIVRYLENEDLNTANQQWKLGSTGSLTPRWQVGANLEFQRDAESDRDLEQTGLVYGTVRRDRFKGGLNTSYGVTERMSLQLSGNYETDSYDSDQFSDVDSFSLAGGGRYRYSERLLLNGSVYGSRNDYSEATSDNFGFRLGGDYQLTPGWRTQLNAGGRLTRTEFSNGVDTEDPGWTASSKVFWVGLKNGFEVEFSRDLDSSSGRNGSVERTSFGVRWYHRYTEDVTVSVRGRYYLNEADGNLGLSPVDQTTWTLKPEIRWRLGEDWRLELAYRFNQLENQIADTETLRHLFYLQLVWETSLLDQ